MMYKIIAKTSPQIIYISFVGYEILKIYRMINNKKPTLNACKSKQENKH